VKSLPLPPEAEGALWRDLVFDPQGRFVFVVAHSVTAYVVPLDGSPPRRLEGLPESRETLLAEAAVSPSGRQVATAFRRGGKGEGPRVLWVWNLETGELRLFDLPEVPSPDPNREQGVWDLAFADDSTLYTSGIGGVRRWDLDTGAHDVVLATQVGSSLTWSGFGPGARTAFVMVPMIGGEYLGPARVLDLVTGDVRDLSTFAKVRLRSSELWPRNAFDATDTLAATGDADGIIRVAPLSGGEPHLLVGHEGPVDYLAISPDGRWVASTGEDNTLRLWPMPDLDQPPRHTLPHDAFVVKLKSLTNIRVVRDPESAEGWKVELDPFPGWAEVPSW
jgi:WD40 repeat protein